MPKADSFENTTAAPAVPTRRRFLSTAAAGIAAGGAAVALASPPASAAADPIFAAIDAFRRADASCVVVHGDITDELTELRHAAYSVVLLTRPSTPAGLAALTTWAREQAVRLRANDSLLLSEDLCALTVSIDDATRGMSGLEPWSPPLQGAIPPSLAAAPSWGPVDPVFGLIAAHKQIMETVRATAADIRHSTEAEAIALEKAVFAEQNSVEFGLFVELTETVPTTLAGVVALVAHLDEVNKTDPWKFEDDYATPLIGALATAFNRMAVAS
jgi:hypothetical protein